MQDDPRRKALIQEYLRRRAKAPETADVHWKLALWCEQNELKQRIVTFLNERKLIDQDKATLIEWGFRLVTYHKAGLQTAAVSGQTS